MKTSIEHPHTKILGLAIEAERKRRRLTQTQLADLSNTSINFVSQVERSGAIPFPLNVIIGLLNIGIKNAA